MQLRGQAVLRCGVQGAHGADVAFGGAAWLDAAGACRYGSGCRSWLWGRGQLHAFVWLHLHSAVADGAKAGVDACSGIACCC